MSAPEKGQIKKLEQENAELRERLCVFPEMLTALKIALCWMDEDWVAYPAVSKAIRKAEALAASDTIAARVDRLRAKGIRPQITGDELIALTSDPDDPGARA
ncbi:hypothetical protein [Afifella sp. YEN Y35]|uniref:hypothetical protein n=1 Tax=Afifella sp. YEN Y35 TaxID=3388337 RepID=UPI0039E1F69C